LGAFAGGDVDYEEEKKFFLKQSPRQSPRQNQTAIDNKRRMLSPEQPTTSIMGDRKSIGIGGSIIEDLDGKNRDIEFDTEVNKYVINKMKKFS